MKKGDLVECISGFAFMGRVLGCKVPKVKQVLQVRGLRELDGQKDLGLVFEEIVNEEYDFKEGKMEPAFTKMAFRVVPCPEIITFQDVMEDKV